MPYIDKDALIKAVENLHDCYNGFSDTYDKACFIGLIEEQPTADVVERKRGHWINRSLNICYPEWERYTCSACGKHAYGYDFCPYCGADMRGDANADQI